MTRPRADAVIRRFLDGASIRELHEWVCNPRSDVPWGDGVDFIEQCIRRRLNAARKGKRK